MPVRPSTATTVLSHGRASRTTVLLPAKSTIIEIANAFTRAGSPNPARTSRTTEPNSGWLSSQR